MKKYKLYRTQSIIDGLKTKSEKPLIFENEKYLIMDKYIKSDGESRLSKYTEYKVIKAEWFKGRLYLTLEFNNYFTQAKQRITLTPIYVFDSMIMYLKFIIKLKKNNKYFI